MNASQRSDRIEHVVVACEACRLASGNLVNSMSLESWRRTYDDDLLRDRIHAKVSGLTMTPLGQRRTIGVRLNADLPSLLPKTRRSCERNSVTDA